MSISLSSAIGVGTIAVDGTTMLTMANATGLLTANRVPPQSSPAATIATLGNIFGASVLSPNGYQVLASGLILQWGNVPFQTGSFTNVFNFPIAFPTGVIGIWAQPFVNDNSQRSLNTSLVSNSQGRLSGTIAEQTIGNYIWLTLGY